MHQSAPLVIVRNGLLAFSIGAGLRRPPPASPSEPRAPAARPPKTVSAPAWRHGFSLIELVLVVLLVAVLVSMLIPSLGRVQLEARITKSKANASSHAKIVTQYTADYREIFPYFTDPAATKSVVRSRSGDVAVTGEYFDAFALWHIALADQYYDGQSNSPTFLDPIDPERLLYFYPCSFIARPEYWDPSLRLDGRSQWLPTRVSDVLYPSQKSLISGDFFNTRGHSEGRDLNYGFPPAANRIVLCAVDGHAGVFRRRDLGPLSPFESVGRPVLQSRLHTLFGARGRDF